jgi:NADPH-dependent curcumin reductase CurA
MLPGEERRSRNVAGMHTGREIRLVSRPDGLPSAENFALADVELAAPGAGQLLVRNTFLSVDPYMRGRMSDAPSYVAPFEVGKALDGGAVGVVESSRDARFPVGTTVLHSLGWRTHAVGPAQAFRAIEAVGVSPSAYLGVLGMPGFTAYVGLFVIDDVKAKETVFISSAAGAVGTIAGQLAKLRGARVIGSTRSKENAKILRDKLRFDDVIVVDSGNVAKQLRNAAPSGIDFYFDNVGGEQLEAALAVLKDHGRVSVCGMIANYCEPLPGPRNIIAVVQKRLRLQGFIVSDHMARNAEFVHEVAPAVVAGKITGLETFVDGLDAAPAAFMSLFAPGAHVGKLIVRIL